MGEYEIQDAQEVMIRLLGRIAFTEKEVYKKVVGIRKEKDKEIWINAFNLCDGEHNQAEIVSKTGVNQGNFSTALKNWKQMGIIFYVNTKDKDGKEKICPMAITRIEEIKEKEK